MIDDTNTSTNSDVLCSVGIITNSPYHVTTYTKLTEIFQVSSLSKENKDF